MTKRPKRKTKAEKATANPQSLGGYFESPDSGTIASASFDGNGAMVVYFKRGPGRDHQRYDYTNIPQELWAQFATAESKGKFFSTQIRPHYAGKPYGE